MQQHYPLKYTLESGTVVVVTKADANSYNFSLTSTHGTSDNFTYIEDNRTRDEIEDALDFDQLNALRVFWLKREDVV
jgi:hypothetical protein